MTLAIAEDIDQSASLDPEGQDRERALQGRKVHGVADEQRPNGASRTNVPEHQGEETRHGSEEGREVRERAKGGQKRARGGAHCGDVRNDTVKQKRGGERRVVPYGAEWRGRGHEGTEEAGDDYGDDVLIVRILVTRGIPSLRIGSDDGWLCYECFNTHVLFEL